ncbi:MAG: FAD-dependent oxidoreductase [bacterium]|nr:FAD-dependent oxidoreductase [bacterium]
MTQAPNVDVIDVAIIGGGPGGTYAGWRLKTGNYPESSPLHKMASERGGTLRVRLYEGSSRIGGRLESLTPPGAPHLRAEFGGMGYSSNHILVKNLVENVLKLPIVDFPSGTDMNINYLRGVFYRVGDYHSNPSIVPYRLRPTEYGKDFSEIILQAVQTVIPNVTTLTWWQWQDIKKNFIFEGRHLYEIGFWNFLQRLMSNEAYNLSVDAGGHFPFIGNWNAAEALEWYMSDFKPNTVYKTIPTGYDQIPLTLYNQFVAAGGEARMESWLTGIQKMFVPGLGDMFLLSFSTGEQILARVVILAMPRRSLELISNNSDILKESSTQALIKTVTPIPVMKIFLTYPYPWWTITGVSSGRSVTDLPVRVVYYIGTENQNGGDPNNTNSLLMASYNDGRFIQFWEGLRQGLPYSGTINKFVEGNAQDYWKNQDATVAMVEELQRELMQMHQLDYIPAPYSAAYKDWSDDPFGGAWNTWNVGVKAWEVIKQMIQPDPNSNLFVCGSAYSQWQGWVEGALQTAEGVLMRGLKMSRPDWLPHFDGEDE